MGGRYLLVLLGLCSTGYGQRWSIQPDGSILWAIGAGLPHADHIEMSGEQVSMWVQYEVDSARTPHVSATMVFPAFRLQPNKTSSAMMYTVRDEDLPRILVNGQPWKAGVYNGSVTHGIKDEAVSVRQKGIMDIDSRWGAGLSVHRLLFPSAVNALALEKFVFTNVSKQSLTIEMEHMDMEVRPSPERAIDGPLRFMVLSLGDGVQTLRPGDSAVFWCCFRAVRGGGAAPGAAVVSGVAAEGPRATVDPVAEEDGRRARVSALSNLLRLETPDTLLNTAFAFAKLRATESIFKTRGGYVHSPGGLRYYAAIWANDQAEYVGPFLAFLGDSLGVRATMTAFRWFARYMNPDYQPIPSSIIAEGEGTWHGAGDRGDMAMIAYGVGRVALTCGDPDSARVLWPLIRWCLEYLRRKVNASGVVRSHSDELEGRFPSGDANLNTSCLYYDALRSAAMLARAFGVPDVYSHRADTLLRNIHAFFDARVQGYDTYRYYDGDTLLRAWIATPLVMGIPGRVGGTIDALFSPQLWTADGLASQAGDRTFWDRATLYALRGVLAAGEMGRGMEYLEYYTQRRLLGEHVPYPVEAYPEGNQRHLSAESGLYCRIFTEGLFGIRPTGWHRFQCTPRLPAGWERMALREVHAFGRVFDLEVERAGPAKLAVRLRIDGKTKTYILREGDTINLDT
ncbi:glucosidase family protein [Dinghuibacter silviterrae]|uniref:Alpha-L-rhamnosidase six-hairpin glycosidase domain-containing protein n=1 Tax=Dinghuibacter silviterrae TaxID=1539049 RepID=A0A4R8DUH0_9BACT|nr:hypothetical protein [Dinghuibacter silviterrae]TDX01105.1 hypothetical protein EDB95_2136 [Dinghuibacter silviterrae]